MLKKILALCMGAMMLAGCGAPVQKKQTMEIIASFYPVYIFTMNVVKGAEGVNLSVLTPPDAGCPHNYSLLPSDYKRIEQADVLVINGAEMESFLENVPINIIIDSSEGIDLLETHGHDGEMEHKANPHIWMSVENAKRQVHSIAQGLAKANAVNAELYLQNAQSYIHELEELRREIKTVLEPIKGGELVTFHDSFAYFANEYELSVAAVINASPDEEPSPSEVAQVVDIVRDRGIKALYAEPQYPLKTAQTVAAETGSEIRYLNSFVSGEATPDAYQTIMRKNAEELKNM